MRDHYYRADMNGVDWDAALARYRPLVERLGSTDDLVDLLWEVQGELGTSHAYVRPRPAGERPHHRGCSVPTSSPTAMDSGASQRILPGEPSDPRARSPLMAPGVAVAPGDAIVAVDGRAGGPALGSGRALLADTAGKPVAADGRERRRGTPDRRRHAARRRDPAALPSVGQRPAGVHPRALRRAARLPPRARHDEPRAGRSCTATCASRWPATA